MKILEFIEVVIYILIFLSPFLIGRGLNNDFQKKYGTEAIIQDAFVWQCIFLFFTILTMFDNKISSWQILWTCCTTIAYIYAITEARTHAIKIGASSDDTIKAMVAQSIYPLGLAMIIVVVFAYFFGHRKQKRRKKRF